MKYRLLNWYHRIFVRPFTKRYIVTSSGKVIGEWRSADTSSRKPVCAIHVYEATGECRDLSDFDTFPFENN